MNQRILIDLMYRKCRKGEEMREISSIGDNVEEKEGREGKKGEETHQGPTGTPQTPDIELDSAKLSCKGCAGRCLNEDSCSGEVIRRKMGRPRTFCCLNCKSREMSRRYFRRHYVREAKLRSKVLDLDDLNRLIEGHKVAGHEGQRCKQRIMGRKASCLLLARLIDNRREFRGLDRTIEAAIAAART